MTRDEFIAYMTNGLEAESASAVRESIQAAFKNSVVASRAESLKAAKEYDDLAAREAALKTELEGTAEVPGTKAYAQWYAENFPKVRKLMADKAALEAKYGTLDAPKPGDQNVSDDKDKNKLPTSLTQADIDKMVDNRIQAGYGNRWGHLVTGMGTVVQRHVFAGRKKPIDMAKFSKLAEQYVTADGQPDFDRAYDEYDKPEREVEEKVATEKRIAQRVNEELQKRGAHANFPAGADATPGTLSRDRDASKFDRGAMERDLVNTFISGEEGGGKLTGFGVN